MDRELYLAPRNARQPSRRAIDDKEAKLERLISRVAELEESLAAIRALAEDYWRKETVAFSRAASRGASITADTAYKRPENTAHERLEKIPPLQPKLAYGSARLTPPHIVKHWQHIELHLDEVNIGRKALKHIRIKIFAKPDQVGIELRPETKCDPDGEILFWPDEAPSDQWGKFLRLEISNAATADNSWSGVRTVFGDRNLATLTMLLDELSHPFARASSTFAWDSVETQQTWLRHCRTIREAIAPV